jgi:multidrug resistance efflux pump
MTPEPLSPVPSPPEHHWRQFRVNIIPGLAFAAVLVTTIWLWGKNLANPTVMGQAESIVSDVASPKSGRIAQLNVALFQEVKAGDIIAVVDATDPRVLSNTLAVIRAEMALIRAEAGLDMGDRIRLAEFRMLWMENRAELAAARAQLAYAESEFSRQQTLFDQKLEKESVYEYTRRDRDQLLSLVEEKATAVATAEKALKELDPATSNSPAIQLALAVAEQKLQLAEAQLQPIILTAPIGGRISRLEKLAGATVVAGDDIATIANPTAERIVGYLSQPLRIEPKVGMRAEIRCRGLVRNVGEARITQIGPRIEAFDAPLRVRGMGAAQERGLPIIMSVPPNLSVRPGEIVDIRLLIN